MIPYDFFAPRQIHFGWGGRAEIGRIARPLGSRAFVVSGSRTLEKNGSLDALLRELDKAGIRSVHLATITHEPEVADVDDATARFAQHDPAAGDFVIAIGGGSALDLGKAVAAILPNRAQGSVRNFLEGVGTGATLKVPPLPLCAIPTTAGTGTEATKNAVISCYDPPFKKSLRSDLMIPAAVLIDPELAVSLPAATTAHTGMDAITQLIESYLSRRARPIPQALCLQGLEIAPAALLEAVANPTSRSSRESLAHAALLSGMALANSGLGLAHGVAAALGVHCRVTHGLACAVMLPAALRVNRDVRLKELARLGMVMTGRSFANPDEAADAAIQCVEHLCSRLNIPNRLSELGVRTADIPDLVASSRGNSMSGNPRDLSDNELTLILEKML